MNESVYLIDEWTVGDLYKQDFWGSLLETTYDNNIQDFFQSLAPNDSIEKFNKINELYNYWDLIPQHIKTALFDNDPLIFSVWLSELNSNKLDMLPSIIKNNGNHSNDVLREFILKSEAWQKIYQQKREAFEEFNNNQETFLLDFLSQAKKEKLVTLAAKNYILVGGNSPEEIETAQELMDRNYKLIYTLQINSEEEANIPILVYQLKLNELN